MHRTHPKCSLTVVEESINPHAEEFAKQIKEVQAELKMNLGKAQECYKHSYDRHTIAAPNFKTGYRVWLNRWYIRTTRPSQKLDVKRMGPFWIVEKVGEAGLAYRLELPSRMRVHPVFHVSLLEPYVESGIRGRKQEPPLLVEVEGELEYEVNRKLDSRIVRGKLRYLVDWIGYGLESTMWKPAEYIMNAADDIAAIIMKILFVLRLTQSLCVPFVDLDNVKGHEKSLRSFDLGDERTLSPVSPAGVAYGATRVAKPWTASETLDY